jgi:hypothetical protein
MAVAGLAAGRLAEKATFNVPQSRGHLRGGRKLSLDPLRQQRRQEEQ